MNNKYFFRSWGNRWDGGVIQVFELIVLTSLGSTNLICSFTQTQHITGTNFFLCCDVEDGLFDNYD